MVGGETTRVNVRFGLGIEILAPRGPGNDERSVAIHSDRRKALIIFGRLIDGKFGTFATCLTHRNVDAQIRAIRRGFEHVDILSRIDPGEFDRNRIGRALSDDDIVLIESGANEGFFDSLDVRLHFDAQIDGDVVIKIACGTLDAQRVALNVDRIHELDALNRVGVTVGEAVRHETTTVDSPAAAVLIVTFPDDDDIAVRVHRDRRVLLRVGGLDIGASRGGRIAVDRHLTAVEGVFSEVNVATSVFALTVGVHIPNDGEGAAVVHRDRSLTRIGTGNEVAVFVVNIDVAVHDDRIAGRMLLVDDLFANAVGVNEIERAIRASVNGLRDGTAFDGSFGFNPNDDVIAVGVAGDRVRGVRAIIARFFENFVARNLTNRLAGFFRFLDRIALRIVAVDVRHGDIGIILEAFVVGKSLRFVERNHVKIATPIVSFVSVGATVGGVTLGVQAVAGDVLNKVGAD